MENIRIRLGDKIRTIRLERGITQEDLGFLAGLHRTYVGSVERGERNISIDAIYKISRALKTKLKDLFSFDAMSPESMGRLKHFGRIAVELAHVRKDGSVMPEGINVRPMIFKGKNVILSGVRDSTGRKNVEDVRCRAYELHEILVRERTAELTLMNEQLRNLSTYLQNASEEERTMVARDIHDELGQSLMAIKFELSSLRKKLPNDQKAIAERVEYVVKLAESTLQSVERISTELRPRMLDHIGLTSAIEWQAAEFEKRNGIACTVVFEPEEILLDRDRSTAVFRIFQESLTNVTRHANASKVEALMRLQDDDLLLRVKDNGKGITEREALDAKSTGIIGMRERVHYWGGSFALSGSPDQGTTVTVRLPLGSIPR
jgi:signal transduction histidine kinase